MHLRRRAGSRAGRQRTPHRLTRARTRPGHRGWRAFRSESATGRLAIECLAVHRRVEREERVERHDRPVGAECEHSARAPDRSPRPGPTGALGADVAGPRLELIWPRVGVIRLYRGHHPEPGEARDVGTGDRLDVLDPMSPVGIASTGSAPTARSYASSAIRIPASPMAWISNCQPRRSASATKASSVFGSHSGRPVEVSSTYGSSMAAVRASMTPSANALTMPASSHFPPRRSPTRESYSSRVVAQSRSAPPGCIGSARRVRTRKAPSSRRVRQSATLLRFDPCLLDRSDPGAVQAGDGASHRGEGGCRRSGVGCAA